MTTNRRPNVVFVMTDQENLRALSCYRGTVLESPTTDRIAKEGVLFENAYCAYPACMPSRAAFMTGRYPHANGVRFNGITLPLAEINLPQLLREAGYTTALCGKDHCFGEPARKALFDHAFTAMHSGIIDEIPDDFPPLAREATDYYRKVMRPRVFNPLGHDVIPFPPAVCDAGLITESAVRFIERSKDHPFFLWLSYPGPHWPFACPKGYETVVPPDKIDMPPIDELGCKPQHQLVVRKILGLDKVLESDLREVISLYYGNCRYIDDQLSRVLDKLETLGLDETTIIIRSSDHGEYLGEHGLMHKSPSVYDALTKIPFIWRWPGHIAGGTRCAELVEGVDFMPTLLDLCRIEVPAGVQGISHASALLGQEPYTVRDACFCEGGIEGYAYGLTDLPELGQPDNPYEQWSDAAWAVDYWCGRVKMVRTKRWKLGYYSSGEGELYDMAHDHWELHNLYESPDHQDIIDDLKHKLLHWLMASEDELPALKVKTIEHGMRGWSIPEAVRQAQR